MREQLERIRAMDPEMTDLGAILDSNAGERFRQYVGMGLDFVDAYTLAAQERLGELRERRMAENRRANVVGKGHLSATSTHGRGGVSVPAGEMAIIRALVPAATEDESRRRASGRDRLRLGDENADQSQYPDHGLRRGRQGEIENYEIPFLLKIAGVDTRSEPAANPRSEGGIRQYTK